MKILVVEDENALREVIVRSLEKERYVIESASSFREASLKINDYDYDCIVLDIMLPGGSGLTLLKELKALRKKDSIIIISAKDSIEDKVTGLDSSKYTEATWTAFETELNEAIAVYEDLNAMQEEVNTAYSELVTAFLNLRLIPDKSLLEELINKANGLNAVNYTKASFDGLTKALNEAKAVYENPNATQEEVNSAKDVLEKAINSLEANTTTPVDNTAKTPVNNGDTTASVKTGDESLVGMFATIALLSVAGYVVLRRKQN